MSDERLVVARFLIVPPPGHNEKEAEMPKYVILVNWTDQGAKSAKDTVSRFRAARQLVESKGGTFDTFFWTLGPFDMVAVSDVPDDETGTAINLALASTGNVRTLTMRAFTEDEMPGIIAKMG